MAQEQAAARRSKPEGASSEKRIDEWLGMRIPDGLMATTVVRSTYALDVETVRALERIAQAWRTSKSEALRRVIRAAAGEAVPESDPLKALDGLQRTLG